MNESYWSKRYENNETGWDIGEASKPLIKLFHQFNNKEIKILIPGCGNAYEAEYLYNKGFTNVYIIDITEQPLKDFKNRNPNFPENQILHGDFFEHKGSYDLIIEQTFFCAINPELREKYVLKCHALLNQKGSPPLSKAVLILLNSILITGLIFSYTRAAWLSVFCAGIIGLLVYFRVNFKLLLGLGLALGFIIYAQWDNIQLVLAKNKHEHTTEAFEEKIQSAANVTTDASNLERINRWDCAYQMFKKRPVLGFGPGTYAFEYAPFQDPENLTIISTNFGDMGNAHSEYLSALSESGIIGLLLFISIVASIFTCAIKLYYKTPSHENDIKLLIMGIIISLSTYFIHAFLNNYLDTDKAAVPIWAMCAMIIAMSLKANDQSIVQD